MKAKNKWPLEYAIQVGHDGGAFHLPYDGGALQAIASVGGGWDHLSVHAFDEHGVPRLPTWPELQYVRRLFFRPSEWAVHYSPPAAKHINLNDYVLHLWRPQSAELPIPPEWMV